jgi:hypothetical protein
MPIIQISCQLVCQQLMRKEVSILMKSKCRIQAHKQQKIALQEGHDMKHPGTPCPVRNCQQKPFSVNLWSSSISCDRPAGLLALVDYSAKLAHVQLL